jgi:hypothetical protein
LPIIERVLLEYVSYKAVPWAEVMRRLEGYPKGTLKGCFFHLKANPSYFPDPKAYGAKNRKLSLEQEDEVWKIIKREFLDLRYLFTDEAYIKIAQEVYHKGHIEEEDEEEMNFKASRHWVRDFRLKHMVSLRTSHLQRRAVTDKESAKAFLWRLREEFNKGFPSLIVNCDETNWPVVWSNMKHWVLSEGVRSEHQNTKVQTDADMKSSFTAMGTITADGKALPLFMLARGLTERCEKQITPIDSNQVTHSPNGWVTVEVMEEYFEFLRVSIEIEQHVNERHRILLVLDLYPSHREEELRAKAEEQRIELLFIPPGMTDCLQPLDAKIFGQLKSAGSSKWVEDYLFDPLQHFGKAKASVILQKCWSELKTENIIDAWKTIFRNGKKFFSDEEDQKAICPEDDFPGVRICEEDWGEDGLYEPPLEELKKSKEKKSKKAKK